MEKNEKNPKEEEIYSENEKMSYKSFKSNPSENAKYLTSYHLRTNRGKIENEIEQILGLQISDKRIIEILVKKIKEKIMVIDTLKIEYNNLFKNFEDVCEENRKLQEKNLKKKVKIFSPKKSEDDENKNQKLGNLEENFFFENFNEKKYPNNTADPENYFKFCDFNDENDQKNSTNQKKFYIEDEYNFKHKARNSHNLRKKLKTYLQTSNLTADFSTSLISKKKNLNFSLKNNEKSFTTTIKTNPPLDRKSRSLNTKKKNFEFSKESERYKKFFQAVVKIAKQLSPVGFGVKLEKGDKRSVKYLWKWLKGFFEEYMRVKVQVGRR